MATAREACEEDIIPSKNPSFRHSANNNVDVASCKDLLRVCPERGLEKYLLKKNVGKDGAPQKTFKPSASQVLRQVKDFLPIMKEAQQELQTEDLNIEKVDEDQPYIDMDVQLVKLQDSESSTESESEEEEENNGSKSSKDFECQSEKDFHIGEVTTNNFVISKPSSGKKPMIEDIT